MKGSSAAVVVVTGASAGVGRAAALAFARRGAHVALLARGRERLEAAHAEIVSQGGQAVVLPTDVADPDQVEAAAESVETELGPIDVWLNNAMATVFSPVEELRPEEVRRATEVTYLGAVYGTLSALRWMKPRDCGHIIQVGSALAYRSIPFQAPYCGAKHALKGFTDSLRSELIHDRSRVRLTMVHLPALNTPQFEWGRSRRPRRARPVGQIYQPDVAADAIVWASRRARREVWVGLSTVQAILGNRLIPGLLDRYLARKAWDGQMTGEPATEREGNLFEPVSGDFGARGRFGQGARLRSLQLWASTHRGLVVGAASGAAAALGYLFLA